VSISSNTLLLVVSDSLLSDVVDDGIVVVGWSDDGLAAADADFIFLFVAACYRYILSVCPCPHHNTTNSTVGRREGKTSPLMTKVLLIAGHESTVL
jgi:hypothetical protein